ncbi:MAG TPA: PE-PPE domain-containing protein [Mycobacterium sp.]|nr:PE-PPE domain-containing protein [Mycobacterium sp.]
MSAVSLAIAGTTLLGLPPAPSVGPPTVTAAADLLSGEASGGVALLPGGSGVPIPPMHLVQEAFDKYIAPNGYADYIPTRLFTPEGLNPIFTPPKSLTLDASVAQGVTILNNAIEAQLGAGHNVVVGGVSQSATIASLEMRDIANGSLGVQPTPDQLAFFMVGNPNNPNGGMLSRFDLPIGSHPSIPSLGITFSGATPADTDYPTYIWSGEYDGFADFPRYPLNVLSDINAFLGILYVHGEYFKLDQDVIDNAIKLPTSAGYDGGTTYYMLPTNDILPLVEPLRGIPVIGNPLADLLEPDLRVLVNLGYGADPYIGWSDTPADVQTPIGLFPSIDADQFTTILQALADGAKQGINAFVADLSDPPVAPSSSADVTDLPSFTDAVNALTSAFSQAYATLLPTADIATAMLTTLPTYDLTLFADYLQAGDLINAVGMPIAADVGLFTLAAGVEFMAVMQAVSGIQDALSIF